MIRSYKLFKADQPSLTERELVKLTLSSRPGRPAQEILKDVDDPIFWEGVARGSLVGVVYILIRVEYMEHMRGTLETENRKTNAAFKEVLEEEFQKAGL
jgi:hypothetical protein